MEAIRLLRFSLRLNLRAFVARARCGSSTLTGFRSGGAGVADGGISAGGWLWTSSADCIYATSIFSAPFGKFSFATSGRRSALFPATTGLIGAGNGGVDRIAAPAIAPSPARQINVSATVLITGRLLARERAQPLSLNGPRMRLWTDRKEATPRQQMLRTHPYDAAGQAYTLGPTFRAGPSTHRALREFPRRSACPDGKARCPPIGALVELTRFVVRQLKGGVLADVLLSARGK